MNNPIAIAYRSWLYCQDVGYPFWTCVRRCLVEVLTCTFVRGLYVIERGTAWYNDCVEEEREIFLQGDRNV